MCQRALFNTNNTFQLLVCKKKSATRDWRKRQRPITLFECMALDLISQSKRINDIHYRGVSGATYAYLLMIILFSELKILIW